MDVDTAIKHYGALVKHVFSRPKRGGKFKAKKLEEAMKVIVRDVTGDSEALICSRTKRFKDRIRTS